MSRITVPPAEATLPAASPLLAAVEGQLGSVPNLFRLLGSSPAVLEGFLSLSAALGRTLDNRTRNRIALATAEVNGCDYCLSAHSYLGEHLAKLDAAEMAANRRGRSLDVKADAALTFARKVAETRGKVSDADLAAVRAAGFSDAQVVEIVANVALNVLTNMVNNVALTDIDFPVVRAAA
jgi:uncharacterized peroxidase-related enzyme